MFLCSTHIACSSPLDYFN